MREESIPRSVGRGGNFASPESNNKSGSGGNSDWVEDKLGENDGSGGKSGISVKLIGRGGNCKSFGESIGSVGKSNSIRSGGNSNLLGTAQLSKASRSEGKAGSIVSKSLGSAGNSTKAAEPEIKSGSKSSGSKGNSAYG